MFDFLFNPQGRISRKGFWLGYFLPYLAINVVLTLGEGVVPLFGVLGMLVGFFYLWPGFVAVPTKRLHDLGRSGWWLLAFYGLMIAAMIGFAAAVGYYMAGPGAADPTAIAAMTPQEQQTFFVENIGPALSSGVGLVSAIVLTVVILAYYVVLGILPGQRADNQYGRDPLAEGRGFAD